MNAGQSIVRASGLVLVGILGWGASPLAAQLPAVVEGRVEDASDRSPVAGATVLSSDSSAAVLTDSVGHFMIELSSDNGLTLFVERLGYIRQRFDLPADARIRPVVLRLEQGAIELEGVTAQVESNRAVLEENLEERRNFFAGAMRTLDRAWLERFAPVGTAFDLVRSKLPRSGPCNSDRSQLCVPGRSRSIRTPFPTRQLTVCIDGWKSTAAIDELSGIDIGSVALVELYASAGVKLYTEGWMQARAVTGRLSVFPDTPFGLSCQ